MKRLQIFKQTSGFTLIEVVIYIAILSLISGVVIVFILQTLGVTESSRRIRESFENGRGVLSTIAQEVRHADSIDTSNSVFGSSPGQLSLETRRDVAADETNTYVDFYVDNEGLFLKREGQSAELLTSEKIKVTNLTFTNLSGTGAGTVRISLTLQYDTPVSGPNSGVTLTSTATVRTLDN